MNFIFVLLNICLWIFLVVVAGMCLSGDQGAQKIHKVGAGEKGKGGKCKNAWEVLKQHRLNCKMTQEFVAETLGVSRQAVSKWESGGSLR